MKTFKVDPFKIKDLTPEQNVAIQKFLFERGYRWCGGYIRILHTDESTLSFYNNLDVSEESKPVLFWGFVSNVDVPEITFKEFEKRYLTDDESHKKPEYETMIIMITSGDKIIERIEEPYTEYGYYEITNTLKNLKSENVFTFIDNEGNLTYIGEDILKKSVITVKLK